MSSYRETLLQSIYNKVKSTEDCAVKPPTKSNKLSDKLRSQGNKFFSDGLFLNAIDEYNKSLCFAELTGDQFNLSVAYANRADALFRMDLPRDCLKSIELAKAANYPEHLELRLTLMAARCQEKIKFTLQPRPKYRLQLSHPANEGIPFVAKNLRLKESEEFGRHIVTTQDLNVGDVIMIERPFVVCSPWTTLQTLFALHKQREIHADPLQVLYERHVLLGSVSGGGAPGLPSV